MARDFEKAVAGFIKGKQLFGPYDKVLVAVSGGADSMAVLHVLVRLQAEGCLRAQLCCAAHLNHRLRAEQSDSDEEFVASQVREYGLRFVSRDIDVLGYSESQKLSIETAGRMLRIKNLIEIARKNDCDVIVTGHQKNDNAETVLQRIARGTGFRGLAGIWPRRRIAGGCSFVRPLLCVTREEIINFLSQHRISRRVDRTNADFRFRRNFIRHRLMPFLQRGCGGVLAEELFQLSQSAYKLHKKLLRLAEEIWSGCARIERGWVEFEIEKFTATAEPIQVELIRMGLRCLEAGERDWSARHYKMVVQLIAENKSGKEVSLPGRVTAAVDHRHLMLYRPVKAEHGPDDRKIVKKIKVPGRTVIAERCIEAAILKSRQQTPEWLSSHKPVTTEYFDLDKLKLPLSVRFRQTGDRFVPLGQRSGKKVGKFITASKLTYQTRGRLLIVSDNEKIIWLLPVRISELAKVTKATRKILQLCIVDSKAPE